MVRRILILASWAAAAACAPAAPPPPVSPLTVRLMPDTTRTLWSRVVTPRLKGSPWTGPGRYDAVNFLMVPLHAAFSGDDQDGQRAFAEHVQRFLEWSDSVRIDGSSELSWLQYFYLLSRFAALSAERGRADLVPPVLVPRLRGWIEDAWRRRPAAAYTGGPFPGGMRERVLWKLHGGKGRTPRYSYERAILDTEIFVFAIAADLRSYDRSTTAVPARDSLLEDIRKVGDKVFHDRVVRVSGGGWVFQPGVWNDHPDFRYACRTEKQHGMLPCPPGHVAEDASHSHRFPLWIWSLAGGERPGSREQRYYQHLLESLEAQFVQRIAVRPDSSFAAWRMHNFMDGGNGIYRWGYQSLGPDQGYGPYEVSGTLVLGWWGFLPGPRIRELFRDLASRFPLSSDILRLYGGPRRQEPGQQNPPPPTFLTDGTAELLCRLASGD